MASVRVMCCSTEDSNQAEEEEHEAEDSGDVRMEEAVKDLCHSDSSSVPFNLGSKNRSKPGAEHGTAEVQSRDKTL